LNVTFPSQDPFLKYQADHFGLTVISVGYRLAPEDPWPAGGNDCYDAAEYFIDHGKEKFGGELLFAGGEVSGPVILLFFPISFIFFTSRLNTSRK